MPEFVSAYADDDGNTVVSVPAGFAKAAGLHTLKEPATDANGRPLGPREGHRTSATKAADPSKHSKGGSAASKPEEAS